MQSSPPFDLDETNVLEQGDDTDIKWVWSDQNKRGWEVVTNELQQFYEHWRESSTGSNFLNTFPYKLSLGMDSGGVSHLPLHTYSTSENRILVTRSYENMFHRVLHLRNDDKGSAKGVVLTGQPGIGKTIFLIFMLVRLISARQVVLLCDHFVVYLFYRGKVYSQSGVSCFDGLPTRQQARYCPIWALIDVDFQEQGPSIRRSSNIWPIQASPPGPARWRSWSKQNGAPLLGMPLWNTEELVEGFCLHPEYNYFRSRLKQFLPFLDGLTPPTNGGSTINAALKVLWTERQREKVMEAGEKEDCDEMGDCARASAADQDENMIDEAGRPLALVGKVDDALKILVHNATEVFGFAPRDVYNGIIDLPETRARHRKRFDCSTLQAIVEMFSYKYELSDFAEHVIVVYPVPRFDNYDDWAIDFKSIRIAREAVESMRSEQDGRLRETYHRFCMIPEGSIMAGWIFEAIIHRMLSYGWRSADGPTPQPIRMASNGCDPPTFSSTRGTSLSSLAPLGAHTRTFIRVDFTEGLSNVKLDSDRYYVPTVTNNPLFDSFTIDLGRRTVVISVFQIATSPRHGGSGKGYTLIRKIMARVGKLLEKAKLDVKIKVVYFLVCPEDESQHQWQMPVNCNKDAGTHDHREDVFCVRVPVRRGFY